MSDYPGAGRHHQGPHYGGPPGGGNYGPPVTYGGGGGPGGYSQPGPTYGGGQAPYGYGAPPPGPPPGQFGGGYQNQPSYGAPPPGPPPPQPYHHQRQDLAYNNNAPSYGVPAPSYGGGDGGAYHRGHNSGGAGYGNGGWQPPAGQGVPDHYAVGSSGYDPTQHHVRPHGPPPGAPAPYRPPQGDQFYGPQFQNGNQGGGRQQPFFQYSQCNGKRKALAIGCNYIGTSQALGGCINDAHNMVKFLCDRFGYKQEDIVVLTDDARNPRQIPTRENMIAAMNWLVDGARPNDSLFFHYSGHGGQTQDTNGDEEDGFDEVIYPLDHKVSGHIVDDELHDILVKPLPAGCRLTAIFDSCHSATALDLPYVYSTEGKIKEPNLLADAGQGLLSAGISYMKGDVGGMLSGVMGLGKKIINQNSGAADKVKQTKTSPADVVSWSGCKDDQTSADTQIASQATGAMSYAFISALNQNPQQSYQQLLVTIRDELKGKYSQKPQLSASHPMDTQLLFIC